MRHFPFKITAEFKNVWLSCFEKVLETPEKYAMPASDVSGFMSFLYGFSNWMVNTKD
jgi:truncated hemoglobin YjbI